jgi:hypothetical protein
VPLSGNHHDLKDQVAWTTLDAFKEILKSDKSKAQLIVEAIETKLQQDYSYRHLKVLWFIAEDTEKSGFDFNTREQAAKILLDFFESHRNRVQRPFTISQLNTASDSLNKIIGGIRFQRKEQSLPSDEGHSGSVKTLELRVMAHE